MSYIIFFHQVVQMVKNVSEGSEPKMVTKTLRTKAYCTLL